MSTDNAGGYTDSWSNIGTASCHISPINVKSGEETHGDRIATVSNWVITLPALSDVEARDRVVVSATTYEVQTVRSPRTWELSRRVEVVEVD